MNYEESWKKLKGKLAKHRDGCCELKTNDADEGFVAVLDWMEREELGGFVAEM